MSRHRHQAPRERRERPPLDAAALDAFALGYVGRFATTRAKLRHYLQRKLAERGWGGDDPPPLDRIVERMAENGFIDEAAFAEGRGAALTRRGFGVRRVAVALRVAGIDDATGAAPLADAREAEWESALAFARRRRIGPFAAAEPDRPGRERAIGALMRAGHSGTIARRIASFPPGQVPERDD